MLECQREDRSDRLPVGCCRASHDGNVGRDTAVQLLGVDKKLLTENTSRGWRLCITTFRRNALPLHSEAVVVLAKDGIRAYRVLYVDDEVGRPG
jgi:hypothetical protein